MNTMNNYLALLVVVVVSVGGCGKKDESPAATPQPSLMTPGERLPVAESTPQLPDPNVPKGAEVDLPKPGQANDHSSPAFKSGGKTDKTN